MVGDMAQNASSHTEKFRTETDLLGTRDVPAEAYYGVHTVRAMANFRISGTTVNDVPEFIRGMVMVKKAAAIANRRIHTIPNDVADAIIWACDQVLVNHRCMDQFPIDLFQGGAGTSVNMNTNEVIANLALEYLGYPRADTTLSTPTTTSTSASPPTTPTRRASGWPSTSRCRLCSWSSTNSNTRSTKRATSSTTSSPWAAPSCRTRCP